MVHRADVTTRLVLTGELHAARAEYITVPNVRGEETTIKWMVEDGAEVAAGQKVLELDTTSLIGDMDAKRLALVKAEAELEQKEYAAAATVSEKKFLVEQKSVDLEKARMDTSIPEELLSRQKFQEYQLAYKRALTSGDKAAEDLATAEKMTEAEIEECRIAIQKAKSDIEISQGAINAMTVRAPCAGILVISENRWLQRKFEVGDSVYVGFHIMQIPDISSMNVEAWLSDVDDGKIKAGMPALCTLDTFPDMHIHGVVKTITPVAQEVSAQSLRRAFNVRIDLDKSDPDKMRPGMSVKVEIQSNHMSHVLVAPRKSIDPAHYPPLLLLEDGKDIEVRLGPCNAQTCVIESDVTDGLRLRAAK